MVKGQLNLLLVFKSSLPVLGKKKSKINNNQNYISSEYSKEISL